MRIFWLCPSYHLPGRCLRCCLRKCSASIGYQWTSSLTGVPSLCLPFGRISAGHWEPLSVYRPVLMVRQRELTRRWSPHCAAWCPLTPYTLPTAATDRSPFPCVYSYQHPLFPSLEKELSTPSVQAHVRRFHRTWHRACASLLRMSAQYQLARALACHTGGTFPPASSLCHQILCPINCVKTFQNCVLAGI